MMRLALRTSLLALACSLLLPMQAFAARQNASAEPGQRNTSLQAVPDAASSVQGAQGRSGRKGRRVKLEAKGIASTQPEQPQSAVSLQSGKLTIAANNAPLTQILGKVAAAGGMTIEGASSTDPVLGVFGPGAPGAVLTQLLIASGYNFVLVGSIADGLPRQMILAGRSGNTMPPTPASVRQAAAPPQPALPKQAMQGTARTTGAPTTSDDETESEATATPLGPGAMEHVPPNEQTDNQDTGTRVQQNMQRLQQLQAAQPTTPPQH